MATTAKKTKAPADPPRSKDQDRDPEEDERQTCQLLNQRISRAKTLINDRVEKLIPTQRRYVNGQQHDDGAGGLVRTNLIFSTIATTLPHIYARNPDISCTPSESVPPERYEAVKKFGKTMERVLHQLFVERGQLKKRAKSTVRSTMTTGVGWLKVVFQADLQTDPIVASRMNDIQENLRRIELLKDKIEDPTTANPEAQKLELQEQLDALQAKAEVRKVRGFVIDRVLSEDILLLDETIKDFDYYPESRGIAHRIWFTEERYEETFGQKPPPNSTRYSPDSKQFSASGANTASAAGQPVPGGAGAKPEHFYAVWEIWYKVANVIYWVVEGANKFAREPSTPEGLGFRWYSFFCLGFNIVDGQWWPVSDVDLLMELQDEYNTTRTNFAEHRKASIPVNVVRTGGQLTESDVERIRKRKINEIIVVEGRPNEPLQSEFASLEAPKIDPSVYDTSQIRSDVDWMSGAGDAQRGGVDVAKTATEAEILQQGMMSRTTERQDAIEDFISEMANYAAEICLQELTVDEVVQIAGTDATWPTLSKDEVWSMVQLKVRAGSTGRPNQQREREQWIQLLPQIQETVKTVAEMRAQGQYELGSAAVELLKETLQRFDEYIDIDRFIPFARDNAGAQSSQMLMQVQQQFMQCQQQLQECQGQLQQCQEQLASAKAAEQAKVREAELKSQERLADIEKEKQIASIKLNNDRDALRAKQSQEFQTGQNKVAADKDLADHKAQLEADYREKELIITTALSMLENAQKAALGGTDLEGDKGAAAPDPVAADPQEIANELTSMVKALSASMDGLTKAVMLPTKVMRDKVTGRADMLSKVAG